MPSSLQEKAFPVSLDSLNTMRDYVQKAAEGLPLSPKKIYSLQLSVDEIATNIVSYSGLTDEHARILMEIEIQDQLLRIRLKDQGIPFDPRSMLRQGEENIAKPVEARKIGGLGIYLAVTGVDRFSYEYVNDWNVNQLEVCFDEAA